VVTSRDVGLLLRSKGEDPEAAARLLLAKRQLAFVSTSDKTIDLTSASQLVQLPRFARAGVLPRMPQFVTSLPWLEAVQKVFHSLHSACTSGEHALVLNAPNFCKPQTEYMIILPVMKDIAPQAFR
jgi:hypothetical protein